MATASVRTLAIVSELAGGQWGLLTTAQAERQGVTRVQLARLADAGVLERIDRGVYATTAAPAEHRALRAAWLTLDPTRTAEERLADPITAGVASHTSAAGLHRLGDLLDDEPELTLPYRKQTRRGVRLHQLALTDDDITLVDGLPTTTEERTVGDLLRGGHDPDHVAQIIGQGVRRGVIDLTDLAAHLDPLARRHGQADGQALVEHLLDLVGLSAAALARELAASPAGQGLVAAGRVGALNELIASLAPKVDFAETLGIEIDAAAMLGIKEAIASLNASVDVSKLVEMSRVVQPHQAQLADLLTSSQMRSAYNLTNSSAFRDAIAAATSPAAEAARAWIRSDVGRAAIEAAAQAQGDTPQGRP